MVPVCLPALGQVNVIEIAVGFDHVAAVTGLLRFKYLFYLFVIYYFTR